ncbi:MAG: PIN domain nuclease [Bacteroidales bacterium]|nr:PIN domain nuclease [Bacteroidales bacterium]
MIMVDSSVWIDYFNGDDNPEVSYLDSILGIKSVVIGDLILTEVLQGFRNDKDYRKAKQLFSSLPVCQLSNEEIALKSADNYRALRRQGITIRKTIDTIIATYCIENKIQLLFSDRDFKPFNKKMGLISAIQT